MVSHLLQSIPPEAVYLIVGLMIMVESLGIPVPGEIALVTAAVLAAQHKMALSPAWIAVAASAGAIAGDSTGFTIGRRYGRSLFDRLGRRFPRHFGPGHVALAERVFTRHGVWAVFFGRFIALLRIFAGPLAGSLRMPYGRFLAANASGGIVWAAGMVYLIWFLGLAAEQWLSRFSWLGLAAALLVGLGLTLIVRRKTRALTRQAEAEVAEEVAAARKEAAAPAGATARAEAAAQTAAGASTEVLAPADAGVRAGAGAQVGPGAHAGTGAQRDQAGSCAGASHALERIEPDRVAGRREGGN